MLTKIRLCESELSQIIKNAATKLIREMDEKLLLQAIAQEIAAMGEMYARQGDNTISVDLDDNSGADVYFYVSDRSFASRINHYDRDLEDETYINEDVEVTIDEIEWYTNDGDTVVQLNDVDDIVKNAVEKAVKVEHDDMEYDDELMFDED